METKKSFWAEMTFWKVVLFWLIIPIVVAIVVADNYRVSITKKKLSIKSGVFNKQVSEYAIAGITQIEVYQSFWGRIAGYGTVKLSLAGKNDAYLYGVKKPYAVKEYVEELLNKTSETTHVLVN